MVSFQDMQRYVTKCAGGEWEGPGCWRYDRNLTGAGRDDGLECFLKMESVESALSSRNRQEVSSSLTWLVARPPLVGELEGVVIRTRIREFARDCRRAP